MTDFYGTTLNGKASVDWGRIQAEAASFDRFVVRVEKYSQDREISRRQMKYLHAVVFPKLAEAMTCSLWEAEYTCKRWCGEPWEMIKKIGPGMWVETSKTKLTTKQCNAWIENIWDWTEKKGIHIPPPNKDWREHKETP